MICSEYFFNFLFLYSYFCVCIQGDGVMLRLRAHVEKDGFHLDEQIDRNTGEQKSAKVRAPDILTPPH